MPEKEARIFVLGEGILEQILPQRRIIQNPKEAEKIVDRADGEAFGSIDANGVWVYTVKPKAGEPFDVPVSKIGLDARVELADKLGRSKALKKGRKGPLTIILR